MMVRDCSHNEQPRPRLSYSQDLYPPDSTSCEMLKDKSKQDIPAIGAGQKASATAVIRFCVLLPFARQEVYALSNLPSENSRSRRAGVLDHT